MFLIITGLFSIASFSCFVGSHPIDESLGNFIVDVSNSLFSPSTISAFLCSSDVVRKFIQISGEAICLKIIRDFAENTIDFSRQMSRNNVMNEVTNSLDNFDPMRLGPDDDHRNIIVLDLDCFGALDVLTKANGSKMFVAPAKWLLVQDVRSVKNEENTTQNVDSIIANDDVSWVMENFRNFHMFPDSEVTLSRRLDDNLIRIISLYRPSSRGDLILEDRGYWTKETGLILRNRDPTSRRRRDLRQTELRACLVITKNDTFNHLEDYLEAHIDAATKTNYPWIIHLANRMNATVTFTSRNTWGYLQKNGSWSGMMELLRNHEVDLSGSATFLTSERLGVVDYVQLYTPIKVRFLFRRPPLSYVSNLFTLPFDRTVWMAIGVLLIISIGVLYLAMKWEYVMRSRDGIPEVDWTGNHNDVPTLSDDLLVVMGAVSQQGSYYEPMAVPTRTVVLVILLMALSLYASYTASIVALLQSSADSINTVEELMNSPMKIGINDVVYNHHYFPAFQDPERKQFYENKVKGKKDVFMDIQDGMARVKEGLFAFHVECPSGYQVMQQIFEEGEKCGIHEIDFLKVVNPLLIIAPRSPYREIIRVGAYWIRETGLQYREISRLLADKPVCQGQNNFVSVGTIDCYAAFMTLAYGVGIAFFIFLIEVVWHRWFNFEGNSIKDDLQVAQTNLDTATVEDF